MIYLCSEGLAPNGVNAPYIPSPTKYIIPFQVNSRFVYSMNMR